MVLCSNCGAARDAEKRLCTNCRMDSGALHIPLTQRNMPEKSESRGCNNCGGAFDSTLPKCPHCRFPAAATSTADIAARLQEGQERGGEPPFPLNPVKGTFPLNMQHARSYLGDLGEKDLGEKESRLRAS